MKRFLRSWRVALSHPILFLYASIPLIIICFFTFLIAKLLLRGNLHAIIYRMIGWYESIAGLSLVSKILLDIIFLLLLQLFFSYYNFWFSYLAYNALNRLKITIDSIRKYYSLLWQYIIIELRNVSFYLFYLFFFAKLMEFFLAVDFFTIEVAVAIIFINILYSGPIACAKVLFGNETSLPRRINTAYLKALFWEGLGVFSTFVLLVLIGYGIFGALQSIFYHSIQVSLPVIPSFLKTVVPSLVMLKQVFSVIIHRKEYIYLALGLSALFIFFVVLLIVVWHIYVVDRFKHKFAQK